MSEWSHRALHLLQSGADGNVSIEGSRTVGSCSPLLSVIRIIRQQWSPGLGVGEIGIYRL